MRLKKFLSALVIGAILVFFIYNGRIDVLGSVEHLRSWVKTLGVFAPFVFVALYAAAVVAGLPMLVLTFMMGMLFGTVTGFFVSIAGCMAGISISFFVSRRFAREKILAWLSQNKKFSELDRLAESNGPFVVAMTRLVPALPFWFVNYGFGLTRISFKTFFIWSFIGLLPVTVINMLGSSVVARGMETGQFQTKMFWVMGCAVAVLVLITRLARKKLREAAITDSEQA